MLTIVYLILVAFSAIIISAGLLFIWKSDKSSERLKEQERRELEQDDEDDNENLPQGTISPVDKSGKKIGKKKMAKLEQKAAAKREREAREAFIQQQKKKQEEEEFKRKQEEERVKEIEKQIELEQKLREEEKEKKKQEIYEEWKDFITVEEAGSDAQTDQDQQLKDQQFISHIKEQKIVLLEDLATMFKYKTQQVVDKLRDLDKNGILPGVIDDRGKFIHITDEEFGSIVKFINRRGRVSQEEIRAECNRVIRVEKEVTELSDDETEEN